MPYKDPAKQKEAAHRHYLLNREKYQESHRNFISRKVEWFRELKMGMKCVRCGFDHPAALEFHHLDKRNGDKKLLISYLIKKFSRERLLEEIKKCEIICANCHSIEHYARLYEDWEVVE